MIYVFRPQNSQSARALAEAVDGVRVKKEVNLRRRVKPNDKVVMWGAFLDDVPGKVLNNVPLQSKYEDAVRLAEADIRTVSVSRTFPTPAPAPVDPLIAIWEQVQQMAEDFTAMAPTRGPVAEQGIRQLQMTFGTLIDAMRVAAPAPPPPVGEWLARKNNHVAARDLLGPPLPDPDYYSKRENFVNEYRVHSFMGRSIRLGMKVRRSPNSDTPFIGEPHAWIRSFESGWQIVYTDETLIESRKKQPIRDLAHRAVAALGLNFGAVDIGELADGTLVVLEVNRAAGIEAGTTEAYSRAIRKWITNEWTPDGVGN